MRIAKTKSVSSIKKKENSPAGTFIHMRLCEVMLAKHILDFVHM